MADLKNEIQDLKKQNSIIKKSHILDLDLLNKANDKISSLENDFITLKEKHKIDLQTEDGKIGFLNKAVKEQKDTISDLRKELKNSQADLKEAGQSEEKKKNEIHSKRLMEHIINEKNPIPFAADWDYISFKTRNDAFMGKHIQSLFRNEEELSGKDFRDAVTNNELEIVHLFLDQRHQKLVYLKSNPSIDAAVLNNLTIGKIINFVYTGEKDSHKNKIYKTNLL